MSTRETNALLEGVCLNIVKAARDINNNPDKAKDYIERKVKDVFKAGQIAGSSMITQELFGGNHE